MPIDTICLIAVVAFVVVAFAVLFVLLIVALSRHRLLQIRMLEAINELEVALCRLEQHHKHPGSME